MGVYRRTDADTYWMSLVIDGKRLRQDTGVQDRKVAEEIFAAWQVKLARERWLGIPAPKPQHTVQELLTEYLAKVTPRKAPASQQRDRFVIERFMTRWGRIQLDQLNSKMLEDYLSERLEDVTLATREQGTRDPQIRLHASRAVGLGVHDALSRHPAESGGRGAAALAHR